MLQTVSRPEKQNILDDNFEFPPDLRPGSKMIANRLFCYVDRTEYSFEETRAALNHKEELNTSYPLVRNTVVGDALKSNSMASPWKVKLENVSGKSSPGSKGAITDIFKMYDEPKDIGMMPYEPKDIFKMYDDLAAKSFKPPSPTMHTKDAMKVISDMFNDSLEDPSSNVGQIQYEEGAIVYNPEDDETISRQLYRRPTDNQIKLGVYVDENSDEERVPIQSTPLNRGMASVFGQPVHVMTPLTEMSDRTHTTHSNNTSSFNASRLAILEEETVDTITQFEVVPEESMSLEDLQEESFPNPCDPTSSKIKHSIVTKGEHPEGVVLLFDMKSELKAELEQKENGYEFMLNDRQYQIEKRIGMADYQVLNKARESQVLRVAEPISVWEYYILNVLKKNLEQNYFSHIIHPIGLVVFQNQSWMELENATGYTVSNLLNARLQNSGNSIS
jgi:hypothetical protein